MSADLGRFLQPDPIGFKGDASNLYRYCGNDWANKTDPTGLVVTFDPVDTISLRNTKEDVMGVEAYQRMQQMVAQARAQTQHVEGVSVSGYGVGGQMSTRDYMDAPEDHTGTKNTPDNLRKVGSEQYDNYRTDFFVQPYHGNTPLNGKVAGMEDVHINYEKSNFKFTVNENKDFENSNGHFKLGEMRNGVWVIRDRVGVKAPAGSGKFTLVKDQRYQWIWFNGFRYQVPTRFEQRSVGNGDSPVTNSLVPQ